MLEAWASYKWLTNGSQVSESLPGGGASSVRAWLSVMVSMVHLVFLLAHHLCKCCNKCKGFEPDPISPSPLATGCVFKASLVSTLFLCLLHLAVFIWTLVSAPWKRWHLGVSSLVQVCAWFTVTAAIVHSKAGGKPKHSCLLRVWCILAFVMAAPTVAWILLLWKRHEVLPMDAWVDLLAFPASSFLCMVAIYGRSGFYTPAADGISEPLLQVHSEETSLGKKLTNYATANLYSLVTLSWLDSVLAFGYKKPLELHDIPQLAQKDCAAFASERFEQFWTNMEAKNLLKCLVFSSWKDILINAFFAGLCTCAGYVGPYLIDDFVEYLGGRRRFPHEGYVLSCVFFVAKLTETFTQRQWFFGAQQLGLQTSAALCAVIYNKGLSLSNQSYRNHTSGEIVNYVSVDVERVSDSMWYLHHLWLLPLQISLGLFILYTNLGLAAMAGLGAMGLIMLANIPISILLENFQKSIMEVKDARMRLTSEVLRNMRILKLQAWEMRYLRKVEDIRKVESGWLRKYMHMEAGIVSLFWCIPEIVGVTTFGTCLLMGMPLTVGKVLSALATFRILQDPIYEIPELIGRLAQAKISMQRIQKFLEEQELDPNGVEHSFSGMNEATVVVEIDHACFSWDSCPEKPTLCVQHLQITQGSKVAVCGPVGSGKSSLISCILGEIHKLSGTVKVSGRTAYVAQSAWIQNGKVQDNILFGKQMDKRKYDRVLSACSLLRDLELFSHGDQTEIGERGINLSGGQKQRIQLARALYQEADIYLLDDPFSAVDAHTGSDLFQKCILELLEGKTVLYVTHQLEFLPAADNILVIEEGSIVQAGAFNGVMQSGANFSKLIAAHTKALESIKRTEYTRPLQETLESEDIILEENKTEVQGNDSKSENLDVSMDSQAIKQLIQEEKRETGKVGTKVYWSVVTAVYKGALVPFLVLLEVLFQAFQIASNYWIARATPTNPQKVTVVSNKVLFGVYLGLAACSSLCTVARALVLAFTALKTAQKFFLSMTHTVFRAPMSFFDSTPASRILSRASTDQSALDLEVCNRFYSLACNILKIIGIIFVMSQIAWQSFALFIPVVGLSIWLQRYYIASARELARLVGIFKSPIIHHISESIAGVATIRGFRQESRFKDKNLELIDCYCRPLFHNFAAMEWLCLRLNVLSDIAFVITLLLVVSLPAGTFNASLAGLALTYSLNLSFLQYLMTFDLCHLENKIISVERIQQYCLIPSEAPLIIDCCRPPSGWPWEGTVTLQNLQVQYAPHQPVVLHGITCTFLGGQKIGVVGRTGSGKSTLIQVLFRIIEPVAGKLLIDDIDVSKIGLHDLRSRLSIIPQDPTLFEGTIRNNLDPLEEYTDEDIWKALDKIQLGNIIRAKDEKLDAPVSENGGNWSVGQCQLVCLGRALLKRKRILVLDEATASVDTATDGIIQDIIRAEFTDCTVITVAHRIPTIIDSDRILFLRNGRVAEYDSPARLLEDKSSLFTMLVSEYTRRSNTVTG